MVALLENAPRAAPVPSPVVAEVYALAYAEDSARNVTVSRGSPFGFVRGRPGPGSRPSCCHVEANARIRGHAEASGGRLPAAYVGAPLRIRNLAARVS